MKGRAGRELNELRRYLRAMCSVEREVSLLSIGSAIFRVNKRVRDTRTVLLTRVCRGGCGEDSESERCLFDRSQERDM